MADVTLKGIRKSFGKVETMHGIDLEIKHGEFVVFVGPSGCGKSTLLRLIAGLEDITEGELQIGGKVVNDVPPSERGIAMVFQSYALYPHMTVKENMGFGLKLAKTEEAEAERRVMEAAKILQLDSLLDRLPKNLSGGQRQRVAIGRALVRDPDVFLLDEPLSNLDAALRVQTRLEIARLHREMGSTSIYVTHDQVEAMTLADKIVVLRDGYLEQVGKPLDLYHNPANKFVAGFIGSPKMNFLTVETQYENNELQCQLGGNQAYRLACSKDFQASSIKTFGVRPEHLQITAIENAPITGQISVVERLGESEFAYVTTEDKQTIVVKLPGDAGTQIGQNIGLTPLRAESIHLFDESEKAVDIHA